MGKRLMFILPLFFILIESSYHIQLMAQGTPWVTGYYAGWSQGRYNNGVLPAEEIDFSALTHIIHFAILPRADGTLDTAVNNMVPENTAALLPQARAAGTKVLLCVGGWNSDAAFRGATGLLTRSRFIDNLVTFMRDREYDGIDIDWEPLQAIDVPQYILFITELRLALDRISPRPLLTAAVNSQPATFATLLPQFDQIFVMTYDLSGAWPGWVTWHNAPLFSGGARFPSTNGALPTASDMMENFLTAGIPANKLSVGVPFYGFVWSGGDGTPAGGVTQPRQTWTSTPRVQANVPYYSIMKDHFQPGRYRWDDAAAVPYLSIDLPGSADDKFISFDDERSIFEKYKYVTDRGLGGLFIWELGGGHRSDLPAGQRDAMLQAVKRARNGEPPGGIDTSPPQISFLSPAEGLSVSGTIEIAVNVQDNVGVAGVLFLVDSVDVGSERVAPPYTFSWNTSAVADGPRVLMAVARDAAGNLSMAIRTVNVSNGLPALAAPMLILPLDNAQLPPQPVTFSWSAVAEASTYRLQVSISSSFSQTTMDRAGIASTTSTIEPLDPGTLYYWRVAAVGQNGEGPYSPARSFRLVSQLLPSAPELTNPPNGVTDLPLTVLLTWKEAERASAYQVQVSTQTDFSILRTDHSGISAMNLTLMNLQPQTVYFWRVRALNDAGASPFGEVRQFRTGVVTSVEYRGEELPKEFILAQNYPNPFNPETTIEFALPEGSYVSLMVTDYLGRRVATLHNGQLAGGVYRIRWDGSDENGRNLGSGIYFCRVTGISSDGQTFSRTIKMVMVR